VKTNYNNLSLFESCAIVIAAVGLALIGLEIFVTLPSDSQEKYAAAVRDTFDMHDNYYQVANNVEFVFGTVDAYYNEFYLASTQVLSFPDEIGTPILKFADDFGNYMSSVADNYTENNIAYAEHNNAGKVLGAMLSIDKPNEPVSQAAPVPKINKIPKAYYYHAPELVDQFLNNK
jgi:hypothetical protein